MTKYVISTEWDRNLSSLVLETFPLLQGFRIIKADGFWKGGSEVSAHIEILTEHLTDKDISELARRIKTRNGQTAVLVEAYQVRSEVI